MTLSLKLFPAWVVCAAVAGWVSQASADFAPLPFQDSFEAFHPREFNGAELVSLCAEADQILATLGEYPARNAAPGPR